MVPSIQNIDNEPVTTRLTFNDIDNVYDSTNKIQEVSAPKTIERLEEISTSRALQRRMENDDDDDQWHIQILHRP